jgi:hypothetical protein
MTFYRQPHVSQYDYSSFTRANGCTWTTGCNGIGAVTGGRKHPSPDYLHSLLPKDQETNPFTPGWSIPDLVKACSRYGVTVVDRSGRGWADAVQQAEEGHYLAIQGRSSAFSNDTCSGSFDGGHCIGWHPSHRQRNGHRQWWINDGICPGGRWEYEYVLKAYAQALNFGIQFGVFQSRVPLIADAPAPKPDLGGGNVTIKYATVAATSSVMHLAEGQRLYDHPGGAPYTRMSRSAKVPHVGLAGSVNGKGWRAVIVGTGIGYPKGVVKRTVLYVPSNAGEVEPA